MEGDMNEMFTSVLKNTFNNFEKQLSVPDLLRQKDRDLRDNGKTAAHLAKGSLHVLRSCFPTRLVQERRRLALVI
ncbi:hypothetical protein V5799_008614 [Amblyomma americanum]|uniref:Uncharacterized protein n=1 Tax=Amblyomma americanum TaxID=6943 RepID=A0AAQ4FE70_AMBAM